MLLELDRLVGAQGRDELDHELFGRHVDDLRARPQAMEIMADGVQQMGLCRGRCRRGEQWVERDIGGGGEAPRGVERDLIGLADDEILEPGSARSSATE